jgi:hypothetical protein
MPDIASSRLTRLAELESRRRVDFARQREAFNRLGASQLSDAKFSDHAWDEYCDAVRALEARLEELENVIWSLRG